MEESVRFKPTGGGGFNPLSVYPIGSIYISVSGTNPAELFGGTWKLLKDVFLMASGDKYAAGSTGGEAEHVLTVAEMPKHRHSSDNGMNGVATGGIAYPDLCTWLNGGHINATNAPDNNAPDTNAPDTGDYGCVRTSWVGGGQPHNNLPPYLAVYMWQRVA